MPKTTEHPEVPVEKLRWRCDPGQLPFKSTSEIEPLDEIVGQARGVEAFRYGMAINKAGYNVFVTGEPHTGRMASVEKLLQELSRKDGVPDDLAYVNNFKNPDAPILLRFKAGEGREFRKEIHELVDTLKREAPQIFESQEYVARKKEIMETYERRTRDFFKDLDKRVKDEGFALVQIQAGQMQRPELMPIVDNEPVPMPRLEEMVEKGRFPREEFEQIREKYDRLRGEIDKIFLEVRDLQKELNEKGEQVDKHMFTASAQRLMEPLREKYPSDKIRAYLKDMLDDMVENIDTFRTGGQQQIPGLPPGMTMIMGDPFLGYQVNLIVDNAEQKSPPVLRESYPTYRNLFGSIERVIDRTGVWRTDYSKIKIGSFLKANGGYLVLNLMDAIMEPGVWPALKRALKTESMEIQTFDPFYMFTASSLKPEPIHVEVKVVVVGNTYLYQLLRQYDEDVQKIFRVRADFDRSMDKSDKAVMDVARFVRKETEEEKLRPFDASGVAALVEEAVRLSGRQEKISTSFPVIAEFIREADYWAGQENAEAVTEGHVQQAMDSRRFRSNLIEDKIQEMIDRDSLMISTTGAVVGQVNGLSVYSLGDHAFGRPARITATTALGREGVINIEREAQMSGPIHNKGVYILSGYLRRVFAQNKPLSVSASLAFEQSYSGIEGDSASSTEMYAILSSLSGVPLKQSIAVTGSVNQKGEVQPIGGVNEKVEGFYDVCKSKGLTGDQGVMIPEANVKDLMLRKEVVQAIQDGEFHLWPVKTVAQGVEILTGMPAGEQRDDYTFPEDSVFGKADARLRELVEIMRKFAKGAEEAEKEQGGQGGTGGTGCPGCGA